MDFITLAKARHSVRSYQDKEIPAEMLTTILEAAQAAPSAGNKQPWHFYVVKSKEVIDKIIENSYGQKWIAAAPVVLVVCADIPLTIPKYGDRGRHLYCLQDTAAAIQNILLCVESLGLGACWCGAFDESGVSAALSLKEDMRPIAVIPIGFPANETPRTKRRTIEEIATFI